MVVLRLDLGWGVLVGTVIVNLGDSFHTGAKAVRLRKLLLDSADDEYSDLLGYNGSSHAMVSS